MLVVKVQTQGGRGIAHTMSAKHFGKFSHIFKEPIRITAPLSSSKRRYAWVDGGLAVTLPVLTGRQMCNSMQYVWGRVRAEFREPPKNLDRSFSVM